MTETDDSHTTTINSSTEPLTTSYTHTDDDTEQLATSQTHMESDTPLQDDTSVFENSDIFETPIKQRSSDSDPYSSVSSFDETDVNDFNYVFADDVEYDIDTLFILAREVNY